MFNKLMNKVGAESILSTINLSKADEERDALYKKGENYTDDDIKKQSELMIRGFQVMQKEKK